MARYWSMLLLAMCAALPGGAASADCVFCDRVVVMNGRLAECFAAQVDASLAVVADDTNPFTLVDLSECAGGGDTEKGPVPRSEVVLKTSFILDEPGLLCLKTLVAAGKPGDLDPSRAFDLSTACP